MADKESFLQRWSARKAEAREGVLAPDPGDVAEDAPQPELVDEPESAPDLPDVETLDAASDYTAFLGKNVPQDIANLALRKLWRSDPVLANLDGLNDYDGDYSKVGMMSEVVKTLYTVGKGFMTADDDEVEQVLLSENGEASQEKPAEETAPLSGENTQDDTDTAACPDGEGEV